METNAFLTFAAAAPLITIVIGWFFKSLWDIPKKFIPLLALVLTIAYGLVLVASDLWSGTAAEFIVTVVLVASSASGFQSVARTYNNDTLRFGAGSDTDNSTSSSAYSGADNDSSSER